VCHSAINGKNGEGEEFRKKFLHIINAEKKNRARGAMEKKIEQVLSIIQILYLT